MFKILARTENRPLSVPDGVMMTGGVANNKGVVTELEKQLNTKIFISDKPEFCGAIGAGLFAIDSDR